MSDQVKTKAASKEDYILEVSHLKKYFPIKGGFFGGTTGNVKAVDDVSFRIPRGTTMGLVGESGCGKSTTGRTILRLLEKTDGTVLFNGEDVNTADKKKLRELRTKMQIIFQDPYSSLNPRMTIGQIIEEGLVTHKFYKHGSPKLREHIVDTMKKCGLQEYMLYRYPHQFSGGQRQRVAIARALAVAPKFIVCDECVSALDVSIQSQIINLLQELKEKEHLTYMFISHDLSVVRYISDRICVMYLGNIVELGDAKTIFEDPRHPYTVALLSSIPTTDPDNLKKERILLEGNIPSPIKPPTGCKFHTRCYMACDKCKRVPPQLQEIQPGHFLACHFPERKLDENGNYLFELPKMERRSNRGSEENV